MAEHGRRRGGRGAGGGGLFPAGYEQAPVSEPVEADERGGYAAGDGPYADRDEVEGGYVGGERADGGYAGGEALEEESDEDGYPTNGYGEDVYVDGDHPQAAYADDGYADPGYVDPGYLDDHYVDDADVDEGYVAGDGYGEGPATHDGYVEGDDGYYDDGVYDDADYDDDEYWDGAHPVRHRAAGVGRRHPVLVGFLVLVLVAVLVAGAGILWASRQINPGGRNGPKVTVRIPSGATSAQIGTDLAKAGVIHGGSLFRYYVKIEGSGPLLSGTYVLAKNESYDQAIAALQAGPALVTDKLVIPEGFTLREIAARVAALPGMHLSAAKFLSLSSSGSVRSPLEPAGIDNLEGLVYAATYTISRTDTASDILEEMVGDFDQHMQSMGLAAGAAKLHLTPYQVITVASIVQGEAKDLDQFADTASVIDNRLSSGMTLGTDSTLVYALRLKNPNLDLSKLTYEEPSPYNTRLHKGLPPTPIDNPSLAALAAAINPPRTNLEYFVEINPDGTLGFASTNAGFEHLVTTCQANKLC